MGFRVWNLALLAQNDVAWRIVAKQVHPTLRGPDL